MRGSSEFPILQHRYHLTEALLTVFFNGHTRGGIYQLENEGVNIGPDLLAVTNRAPESLLISILDPDRAVERRIERGA